ncbi:MAG TPA: aldehyde dehydrogenase family protein [Candidatus Limnocylindria bacterium]|nr:aldehyde dehydrogenase family protein [Candidatus Limnocylindria bacterium]
MAKMYINGELVDARGGKTMEVRNPSNGEVVGSIPRGTTADVDAAVDAAAKAFPAWAALAPTKRAALMHAAAEKMRAAVPEIAKLLTLEQGKPLAHAVLEASRVQENLEYYAGLADKIRGDYIPLDDPGKFGLTIRRPIGVVVAITPWNFPLTLMANKVCPALATGCTVVLKPASTTPLATQRAIEVINSAGLPPGVLNIVHGSGSEIGDALVSHKRINKVAFTGQTETGKRIMKLAADNVTRITLELGGSDPVIICDDADLRRASAATAIGRFFNAGQACLAVKRVYVFSAVAEEFMAKIADRAKKEWKIGDGLQEGVKMGPLHTEHQRAEVEAQVADAVKKGATVLAGGTRPEGKEFERGWFMEATVLRDVPEDSRMLTEEVFGPALPIVIVNDLDEAIAKANSSVYGLGSSIWTKDLAKARRAMEQIQAGYTWVNDIQVAYDQLPFGGAKQSGFGKEHGLEALDGYLEKKSVVLSAG